MAYWGWAWLSAGLIYEEMISREPCRVYFRTDVGALLTGLMHDAQTLLRQEVALATHEI
jgi:hypothetical protein